jgi:hypothetical protein
MAHLLCVSRTSVWTTLMKVYVSPAGAGSENVVCQCLVGSGDLAGRENRRSE